MRVIYHPDFPKDIKAFAAQYAEISDRLSLRFRDEVEEAIERIKAAPASAGHFLKTDSQFVKEVRRRNLSAFPFFVLYAIHDDVIIVRSLIPTASDPLTWLRRS